MPSAPTSIGLVFGGVSGEHAVSIRSAATVAGALGCGSNAERYRLLCFYIDQQGHWWPPAVADAVLATGHPLEPEEVPARPVRPGFQGLPAPAAEVDVWFPVLHGPNGEDGTIQGLFTLMQVPFVGSGVLGSAVGMDKQAMKAAFAAAGLPQVPYRCVDAVELGEPQRFESLVERLEAQLGYPCFIKPANLGSSVGISKATNRSALVGGLRAAARHDRRLVVEKGIVARELECAVLGRQSMRASVLGEIRFDADWYDYTTKYTEGLSHTVIPAPVPAAVSERARTLAIEACRAVAAEGLARVDFFYEESPSDANGAGATAEAGAGTLWLNEINTLPGFTSQSMYPMLWAASGLPLEELVHHLVQDAGEWNIPNGAEAQAA
ncbi:D-alanine--D-alanine ligase family protein [Cyanobium sp. Morenito 9A2]|uniref:D-alanine--D-alanine ligase family protein n=1 Tax=Cyanobium sp. Morenito 9A2 TaxID=2823718 RepID=UPI0020CCA0D0|nr:D-alanine--D-alanine ligase family protein [Cyanobium sp. Morenito 9A2]MCP9848224.1 D-alanine--D-alanine ligase [Cyanobium sp. Morenito 9A2]